MRKIFLVLIGVSVTLFADLSKNSAGVVTDSLTTLEWQDNYSDNGDTIKKVNWKDAIKYCNELSLDGEGWRLPNKNELLSIVDYTSFNPSIDTSVFENTTSLYYWSSTTYANDITYAWYVYFNFGNSYYLTTTNNSYVRCVRFRQ